MRLVPNDPRWEIFRVFSHVYVFFVVGYHSPLPNISTSFPLKRWRWGPKSWNRDGQRNSRKFGVFSGRNSFGELALGETFGNEQSWYVGLGWSMTPSIFMCSFVLCGAPSAGRNACGNTSEANSSNLRLKASSWTGPSAMIQQVAFAATTTTTTITSVLGKKGARVRHKWGQTEFTGLKLTLRLSEYALCLRNCRISRDFDQILTRF